MTQPIQNGLTAFKRYTRILFVFSMINILSACGGGGSSGGSTTPPPTPQPTNSAPVAHAGDDVTVTIGETVTLSASQSSDANGDPLTYSWSLTSKPVGSNTILVNATSLVVALTTDMTGEYHVSLMVNDGKVNSTADTVIVTATTPPNTAPIANAGSDQVVNVATTVTLDASQSSDTEGYTLSYNWSFSAKPSGSVATLSDPSSINPSFVADLVGQYQLDLIVNDGTVNSVSDSVLITAQIEVENSTPQANAGIDQSVTTGAVVTLDGSQSSDPDGDPLTYLWSLTSKPNGSSAALSDVSSATPTFSADLDGQYVATLIVNDGTVDSTAVSVTITASPVTSNHTPIANAGADQAVTTGTEVVVSGSASSDADQDTLTYQWSIVQKPDDSLATLSSTNTVTSHFTPEVDGLYILELVVNDGTINSIADSVTITSSTLGTNLSYKIVDTNQQTCYDSASGQLTECTGLGHDGDHQGNPAHYLLTADGLTVTDAVTGLIWTQSSDLNLDRQLNYDDKLLQVDAVSHCENLTFAGVQNWRLPSVKEAYSLMLFSGKDASSYQGTDTSTLTPFIDSLFDWAFGDLVTQGGIDAGDRIIDGQYATSTPYTSTTMHGDPTVFGVNFVDGRIKGYPANTKKFYVRCVSEGDEYGQNKLVDNGDATISDRATGLMWQREDGQSTNWDDAIAQCAAATTAEHDDWRLPNAKELQSIVDYNRSPDASNSPAIDPLFTSSAITNEANVADWSYYWSSTTHVNNDGDGSNAVYIAFGRGLGYFDETLLDVHGAGAQRSNDKLAVATEAGAQAHTGVNGTFYSKGPQGDILRLNNKVRCVR